MGDSADEQIERTAPKPIHVAAPALRGIKNAPLRGATLEVDCGNITGRVINGLGQHANSAQKGKITSVKVISPQNIESRRTLSIGNQLMIARSMVYLPIIPKYRKFRLVFDGSARKPSNLAPFPTVEQVKGTGWFCGCASLIKIGMFTLASYPTLGSILAICGL